GAKHNSHSEGALDSAFDGRLSRLITECSGTPAIECGPTILSWRQIGDLAEQLRDIVLSPKAVITIHAEHPNFAFPAAAVCLAARLPFLFFSKPLSDSDVSDITAFGDLYRWENRTASSLCPRDCQKVAGNTAPPDFGVPSQTLYYARTSGSVGSS